MKVTPHQLYTFLFPTNIINMADAWTYEMEAKKH